MADHLGSDEQADAELGRLFDEDTPLSTRTSHPTQPEEDVAP